GRELVVAVFRRLRRHAQPLGDTPERLQLSAPQETDWLRGEEHLAEHQRNASADQRVDEPVQPELLVADRDGEDRADGRLGGDYRRAAQCPRDGYGDKRCERERGLVPAERRYRQLANHDADEDAKQKP